MWTTRFGIRKEYQTHHRQIFGKGFDPEKRRVRKMSSKCLDCPRSVRRSRLLGIVSRFTDQKGFDLIAQIAPDLLAEDLAIVGLGAGEPRIREVVSASWPSSIPARLA